MSTYTMAVPRSGFLARTQDYAVLLKARVTSLVMMTAWTGFYLGSVRNGTPSFTLTLFHALIGIGMVSAGAAALNQAMEYREDSRMLRTRERPIPTKRMARRDAVIIGAICIFGGCAYLALMTNLWTGGLAFSTAVAYLGLYTPLKKMTPWSTFVGAFPGAMPPLLGWVAVRGRIEWEALVLFAIVWLWQFPHFHSIAWLYREDYERADIRMLPVVDKDGHSTVQQIVLYSLALIPVSLLPTLLHVAGRVYFGGALLLGLAFLFFGLRIARLHLPPSSPDSKKPARELLKASVIYLPLLFALMMLNAGTL